MNRLLTWPVLCGLAGLLLVPTVPGQAAYTNNAVVIDPGNIDTTNFVNLGSFTVTYFTPYETTHTLNYFNSGTMTANSGGFVFDTLTGSFRSMASSFYNPSTITGYKIIVSATNLVNPGVLNVSADSLLQLTGQNLNLYNATLTMGNSGILASAGSFSSPDGNFGTDTNRDWDPAMALTATMAYSSLPFGNYFSVPAAPTDVYSATFQKDTPANSTNRVIYRAIYLGNNTNYGVTAQAAYGQLALGDGTGNVQWQGSYTDPVTGLLQTNYLILNNNYVLGASTNVTFYNGIPSNFNLQPSQTPLAGTNFGTAGIPPYAQFSSGAITNPYSYALVQAVSTTVSPGKTSQNPSGAITNIAGRTQISAGQELNLALANLTGQNYLSLTCTNQFDGNVGATINSPYSDINLGVTNGFLTVSNLVQSVVPAWNGTIQLWSTRFFYTDTSGVTNDFRALIVSSSLKPFSEPQIQDLTLHSTNLVICDKLNVMRTVAIDAQSLTLANNAGFPNNGAGSAQGELNITNFNVFFGSSLPNLLWLTNNGKISLANAAIFGGPLPAINYNAFVNRGLLSDQGSTIYSSYFYNSGTISNGLGNFFLQSQSVVLTNGSITANGDIVITAGSLVAGNVQMQLGRSLTLQATNLLSDNGLTNVWSVGASSLNGFNLPILPAAGDLHGTTISVLASIKQNVVNTWAGKNWGVSAVGYVNNASLGGLILDARSTPPQSLFVFNGTGVNNALYVNNLFLTNTAATLNSATRTATVLSINPNLVIYYQNAYSNGVPVSATINGWNNHQLLWVSPAVMAQTNIAVPPPSLSASGFNYTVSGVLLPNASAFTTNSLYTVIVQTTTNLASANWVNTYTGLPPFTFTNFGYTTNPQQFYRSKQGW